MEDFIKLIHNDKSIIETRLNKVYADNNEFEKMCAYSFSVGGKRIRAILLLEAFKICRDISDIAIDFSVALELIHNYSLVHDDLPEMDDDKFRRGVLSVYGKYGQSNAVLVGDELLNNANLIMFKAIKQLENIDEIKNAISASEIILNSSGINGMIYGQFLDLENNVENLSDIEKINSLKTGELFKAAILAGAKLGGASDNDLKHLEIYAKNLGLVFQLQDDLFDYDEDIRLKKKTFATVLGKSEVEKKIEEQNKISLQEINKISGRKEFFVNFIDYMAKRTY
ncbi:polyprenyl synthetase family protein [Parvimonas micra]|uniref:polyprenyl synthetase family protein n=1 Tax=Parvimonas micra TaxID=33033 RepID=UPI0012385432|nr:polyprenyl synthetase family protein [Parvimonas micra]MCK6130790.1 polyprenyl synthetase family protein [Parvimonas micra]MCK6136435.1 polyprenyl synthetase family protein [Parvimonas micra]MCK6137906.1 polyprenyl synthetase family protein [Parvimonas micra]MCK6154434.1 polyprenyl synthetase family protein [Parvimonas micra]